jgi:hypothetical protein
MPRMPRTIEMVNGALTGEQVVTKSIEDFVDPQGSLVALIEGLGAQSMGADAIIANWPESQVQAMWAAVRSAVGRDIPVNVAWLPGYDYEVTISEWKDVGAEEVCGVTIILRSRHASDLAGPAASSS